MKAIYSDILALNPQIGAPAGAVVRAVILSSTAPSSLNLTGADVDGLGESDIIAAGSLIITPNKNYIAFQDGVFTEKE